PQLETLSFEARPAPQNTNILASSGFCSAGGFVLSEDWEALKVAAGMARAERRYGLKKSAASLAKFGPHFFSST
ncbi:MAG TPA: hypothetical protein VIJ77_07240, partial [Candidatus Tumulicola sp.]